MLTDIIQIHIFSHGLSIFISTLLVVFLFINKALQDRIKRSFIVTLSFLIGWSSFILLFSLSKEPILTKSFEAVSLIFIALLSLSIINFSYKIHSSFETSQSNNTVKPHAFEKNFFYSVLVLLFISILILLNNLPLFKTYISTDILYSLSLVYKTLTAVSILFFFISIFYAGHILLQLRYQSDGIIRKQLNWILASITIIFISTGTHFVTLYNFPIQVHLFSILTPIFALGIFYAVTKRHRLNTKVLITEMLTFAMWSFLLFRILFTKNTPDQILNVILLVALVVLGIFLIKSVSKQVSQLSDLERVSLKLRRLNEILEEKVEERTREIAQANIHTETIIENLSIGLVEYDEDFRILRINNTAEKLLGITKEDVYHKKVTKKLPWNKKSSLQILMYMPKIKQVKKVSRRNEKTEVYELSISHPNNKELRVITVPIIYPGNTKAKSFIKLLIDITHEKHIEKAKGNLLSVTAHQLKTPLSGIKWILKLAIDGDLDKLGSKHKKELIKQAYMANEHMIDIINDFLTVVRMDETYYEYNFKKNDILEAIDKIIKISKFTARGKDLQFILNKKQKNIKAFVFDKQKIMAVLQNIFDNAVAYTPDGGTIKTKVSETDDFVIIEISDTGIGISKEEIPQMFTMFFQSKKTAQINKNSSGLGLFIVKEIIDAHNGKIEIDSQPGKGTNIKIYLPKNNKPSQEIMKKDTVAPTMTK